MLNEQTYGLYETCLRDQAVITADKQWEAKFQALKQAHKEQTMAPEDVEVERHADFIIDNLVNPRCPGCSANFGGFDACSAIHCDPGCGVYFCGWCLLLVERDDFHSARVRCHAHVRDDCRFNPHRNVYPPQPHPQVWEGVMHEWGRKRVKDYIRNSGGVWWMVDGGVRCMALVYGGVWSVALLALLVLLALCCTGVWWCMVGCIACVAWFACVALVYT